MQTMFSLGPTEPIRCAITTDFTPNSDIDCLAILLRTSGSLSSQASNPHQACVRRISPTGDVLPEHILQDDTLSIHDIKMQRGSRDTQNPHGGCHSIYSTVLRYRSAKMDAAHAKPQLQTSMVQHIGCDVCVRRFDSRGMG